MTDVAAIAAGLSKSERRAVLNARASDSFEWWMKKPIGRPEIDGGDGVLTDLGVALRLHIIGQQS